MASKHWGALIREGNDDNWGVIKPREAIAAMLAFAADAPPGWKLVPVTPTPEMVAAWEDACPDAGWKAMQDMSDSEANVALVAAEWSAMLSAAPTPEAAKEVG
jgi:hypothetical protein